jgi:peptide/nickel transport system substrate-binding protein
MRRVRKTYWFINSFIKRYGKTISTVFILTLIAIIGFWFFRPFILKAVGSSNYVIGVIGQYEPSKLPEDIQQMLSSGFTKIDSDGTPEPDTAESWEVTKDGKRYLFKFKDGLYWHDGTEFTAYDVNYNFRDVQINPADRYTLKLELQDAFSPLPNLLAKPLFKSGLVGIGDYKIKTIELKDDIVKKLVLERIPAYRNSSSSKEMLEYRFYPSIEQSITAYKLGEIDTIQNILSTYGLEEEKNTSINKTEQSNKIVALFFNSRNQLLSQKELRQALSYATPNFTDNPITSPIHKLSWAYNSNVRDYSYNKEQAKNYLDRSGYEASESSKITISAFPEYLPMAEEISKSWNELGIRSDVIVTRILPDDYQVLLGAQEIPLDPDQYQLWHSTQSNTNISKYNNPKIDKLLEDGRKEQNKETRKKIYQEFQRYLVEDAPARFIMHPTVYTITRK